VRNVTRRSTSVGTNVNDVPSEILVAHSSTQWPVARGGRCWVRARPAGPRTTAGGGSTGTSRSACLASSSCSAAIRHAALRPPDFQTGCVQIRPSVGRLCTPFAVPAGPTMGMAVQKRYSPHTLHRVGPIWAKLRLLIGILRQTAGQVATCERREHRRKGGRQGMGRWHASNSDCVSTAVGVPW
jgi:hypothetical protein